MATNSKVVSIDKPRCSRCGAFKSAEELNGYDPLAPVGQKYSKAYCRKVVECNSSEANQIIDDIVSQLEKDD